MLQHFLTRLAGVPRLWNVLRWIAEAGYYRHYRAIDASLAPARDSRRLFLDFGCGTGQFAPRFPAERYVGVDFMRPYVRYAARHRPGRFGVMDGKALGLAPQRFDGGLVIGVLHHMPDDLVRSTIGELNQTLKPDATLLIVEDIPPPSRWNVLGYLMHWLDRGDHIRTDGDYRRLFAPHFGVREHYTMRSGICDYGVYVLRRKSETVSS